MRETCFFEISFKQLDIQRLCLRGKVFCGDIHFGIFKVYIDGIEIFIISHKKSFLRLQLLKLFLLPKVPGTAENARSCVRAYFSDLHETLCRQEEMALSVVDAHVREKLIWLRQQQEDMTVLLSQVSTACLHCEKTLQQVHGLKHG